MTRVWKDPKTVARNSLFIAVFTLEYFFVPEEFQLLDFQPSLRNFNAFVITLIAIIGLHICRPCYIVFYKNKSYPN